MRKVYFCLIASLFFIALLVSQNRNQANAQLGGVASEVGDFTICKQQNEGNIRRCILKENPEGPSKSPIEEVVGNWNPFLPNPYYNHPLCYNNAPHLLPGEDPEKDDPSKSIHFNKEIKSSYVDKAETSASQEFDADGEFIPVVEGVMNPDGQEKAEGDEPYMAIFFTERQAITSLKMKLKGGSPPEARSAEYIMYTGFGNQVNPTKQCVLGSVFNIPLDGREYEFKIGDHTQPPMKADYVLIKRLANATPQTLEISDLSIKGVSADKGEPPSGTGIKGKVSITNKSNLTLSNARIYDVTEGEDKKKLIATTNANGNYFSTDLSQVSGKRKFIVERDGFKPEPQSFNLQKNKTLEKNFSLTFAGPNRVSGKITDASGAAKSDLTVLAYKDSKVENVAVTDENGSYRFEFSSKGIYELQPIASSSLDNPEPMGQKTRVTFDQKSGQSLQRNIKTDTQKTKTGNYKLWLTIQDSPGQLRFPSEEIVGATVKIYKGEASVGAPQAQLNNFERSPIDIPFGTSTIVITAKDYITNTQTITNTTESEYFTTIDLEPKNNSCEKFSRTFIKEFWFCGQKAKTMSSSPEFQAKLNGIDQKINSLRQRYGYSDMPFRVVIYSSVVPTNFFTFGKAQVQSRGPLGAGIKCPTTVSNPANFYEGESIIFTTAAIASQSQSSIEASATHELGHDKDWREGKCNPQKFRSDQDDYVTLRQIGELLAREQFGVETGIDTFYKAITESTYDVGSDKGHPQDSPRETYGSAFHAITDHPIELTEYTSPNGSAGFSPDLAAIVKFLTEETQKKK